MSIDIPNFKTDDFVQALDNAGYGHEAEDFLHSRVHYAGTLPPAKIHFTSMARSSCAHVFIMSFPDDHDVDMFYVTKLYVAERGDGNCTAEWDAMPFKDEMTAGEVNAFFDGLAYIK